MHSNKKYEIGTLLFKIYLANAVGSQFNENDLKHIGNGVR